MYSQTCSLLTVNRPSAVGHLYRFVTRSTLEDIGKQHTLDIPSAVNKAALMRESALKSTIFVGVPRVRFRALFIPNHHEANGGFSTSCFSQVILSLTALHNALDDEVKIALRPHSKRRVYLLAILSLATHLYLTFVALAFIKSWAASFLTFMCKCIPDKFIYRNATSDNVEEIVTRGRALWDSIYAPHADKLHDKLGVFHPDFICKWTRFPLNLISSFQPRRYARTSSADLHLLAVLCTIF